MNRRLRPLIGLVAIAAATTVGILTREPGFVVITFFGTLWLPRILGLRGGGRGPWMGPGCGAWRGGRGTLEGRLAAWHSQAHGESGSVAGPAQPGGTVAG